MNHKIATELVDMAERIASTKTAATNLKAVLKKWPQFVPEIEKGLKMLRSALRGTPDFGRVSEALIEIQMRLEDDHRSDPAAFRARTPFNAALADFAKSEFERKTGNRWASTKTAGRVSVGDQVQLAERIAASETLVDFAGDDEELTEFLADYLDNFIRGSSFVGRTDILFYEEETRKGESVQIEITVNPRNQPKKTGKVIVGLHIEDTAESRAGTTYEDGMLSFDITDTVKEVAKTIGQAAQKVLKKF